MSGLVAIDVSSYLASRTGVGVCVGELVRSLLATRRPHECFRLCAVSAQKHAADVLRRELANEDSDTLVRRVPLRMLAPLTDLWSGMNVERLFGKADVFHAGPLLVPTGKRCSVVATIYDVTPLRFPHYHLSSNRFTRQQLKQRLARADLVIVPSTSTRDDLEHFDLVPRCKVRWVPLGVRSCFRPLPDDSTDMRRRLNLNSPYILAVGSLEPRKNLRRLIEAFRLLKNRHGIPHKLAIIGPKGWMSDDIGQLATEEGLAEHVVLSGFVDNELLNSLYNHADVFVYPSLYEGFGFPPLEAMAAGCPVAVSNVSSLPEVVGSAGLYFEPTDTEDIAGAVYRILDSAELRNTLISLGRSRIERYSWRNTADATRAVYAEAMVG